MADFFEPFELHVGALQLLLVVLLQQQRLTVNELLDRRIESRRTRVGAKQRARYEAVADQHLRPILGNLLLAKLQPAHIECAMVAWIEGKRLDKHQGQ